MVTVARGMVAPLVSLIVPVMVPVNDCASRVDGRQHDEHGAERGPNQTHGCPSRLPDYTF